MVYFYPEQPSPWCPPPTMPWWLLLILAPLVEELVFRGFLQTKLMRMPLGRSRWRGISSANLITSALFGLVHISRSLVTAAAVLPPSLVLGWLRERTGKVTPCIVVHGAYNCGLIVLMACELGPD